MDLCGRGGLGVTASFFPAVSEASSASGRRAPRPRGPDLKMYRRLRCAAPLRSGSVPWASGGKFVPAARAPYGRRSPPLGGVASPRAGVAPARFLGPPFGRPSAPRAGPAPPSPLCAPRSLCSLRPLRFCAFAPPFPPAAVPFGFSFAVLAAALRPLLPARPRAALLFRRAALRVALVAAVARSARPRSARSGLARSWNKIHFIRVPHPCYVLCRGSFVALRQPWRRNPHWEDAL